MISHLSPVEEVFCCVICKQGIMKPGRITITLEQGRITLVFKQVPADVCENCGEQYLNERTTRELLEAAGTAEQHGIEVEVRSFTPSLVTPDQITFADDS